MNKYTAAETIYAPLHNIDDDLQLIYSIFLSFIIQPLPPVKIHGNPALWKTTPIHGAKNGA